MLRPEITPTHASLRHHHEPKGSEYDGVDCESLAPLLAVAIAAFFKRNHNLSRTRAVAAWEIDYDERA